MKFHLILIAVILVLCGAVGAFVYFDAFHGKHHEAADGEHDEHSHAPGEICEECLEGAVQMAADELKVSSGAFTPTMPPAKGKRTRVRIVTSMGEFEVILYDDLVPKTVGNFLELAKKGFYNGLVFHRVIRDFMNQTGCPEGTGRGGPGYTFADEFAEGLIHGQPGVVSMANAGANTNGSQFFITVKPALHLNWKHAVFGQVVKGIDVVYAINRVRTGPGDRPVETVVMKEVIVLGQEEPVETPPATPTL